MASHAARGMPLHAVPPRGPLSMASAPVFGDAGTARRGSRAISLARSGQSLDELRCEPEAREVSAGRGRRVLPTTVPRSARKRHATRAAPQVPSRVPEPRASRSLAARSSQLGYDNSCGVPRSPRRRRASPQHVMHGARGRAGPFQMRRSLPEQRARSVGVRGKRRPRGTERKTNARSSPNAFRRSPPTAGLR